MRHIRPTFHAVERFQEKIAALPWPDAERALREIAAGIVYRPPQSQYLVSWQGVPVVAVVRPDRHIVTVRRG